MNMVIALIIIRKNEVLEFLVLAKSLYDISIYPFWYSGISKSAPPGDCDISKHYVSSFSKTNHISDTITNQFKRILSIPTLKKYILIMTWHFTIL